MPNIEQTLNERGKKYGGSFLDQSQISQQLKQIMHNSPNWQHMRVDKREALEMIATKLSRILFGDHNEIDSWHDIIGYARLIERRLENDGTLGRD